jgi:hypothetical protein
VVKSLGDMIPAEEEVVEEEVVEVLPLEPLPKVVE